MREGLNVVTGLNVAITVELELAGLEEALTVRGESPVVDLTRANVSTLYTSDMVERAPTSSGLWSGILARAPTVVLSDYDIGGIINDRSDQGYVFSARGSAADQNTYSFNGGTIQDSLDLLPNQQGMFFSNASFEEVQVSTTAHDIEFQRPGVVVNMVTKHGTNTFHGGVTAYFIDHAWQSENLDEELIDRGAEASPGFKKLEDFDFQLGGPIVRERTWFFVDHWRYRVDRRIVGLPNVFDDSRIVNWTARGTYQVTDDLKVSGLYNTSRKKKSNAHAAVDLPVASSAVTDGFTRMPQLQGQYVVSENGFLETRFSRMNFNYDQFAQPGVEGPVRLDFELGWSGPWRNSELNRRKLPHLRVNYSHFLVSERQSHHLKVGMSWRRDSAFLAQFVPGGVLYFGPDRVFLNNTPRVDDVRDIQPPNGGHATVTETSLYVQDSWRIGSQLTANLGLRYDRSVGSLPAQARPESFFPELGEGFQAASFPAEDGVTRWGELQPRVSVVYDLVGDGKWALKGSYAGYTASQSPSLLMVNVAGNGNERWTWEDKNGNGLFEIGEQLELTRRRFPRQTRFISGDLKAPVTQEVTVGIDHELVEDVLLSATYIRRRSRNIIAIEDRGVPFDPVTGAPSYELVPRIDPGPDGELGTPDDGGTIHLFNQIANFGENLEFVFNPDERDLRMPQRYDGVELLLSKHWSRNWQVLGSWTIQRARGLSGRGVGGSPTTDQGFFAGGVYNNPNRTVNTDGEFGWSRTHVIKVTGSYLIDDPVGVNVGVFFQHFSGYPWGRTARFELDQGGDFALVERRGTNRSPSLSMLDLRAEKQFPVGADWGAVHLTFDIFNLFNVNTVTGLETHSGPRFGNVHEFAAPRVVRAGFAWRF